MWELKRSKRKKHSWVTAYEHLHTVFRIKLKILQDPAWSCLCLTWSTFEPLPPQFTTSLVIFWCLEWAKFLPTSVFTNSVPSLCLPYSSHSLLGNSYSFLRSQHIHNLLEHILPDYSLLIVPLRTCYPFLEYFHCIYHKGNKSICCPISCLKPTSPLNFKFHHKRNYDILI